MPSYHYQARVPLVWYILSDTVRWYYWYGISYIYQVSIAHHLRNIRVQRSVRAERLGAKEVAATAAALMASLDNRRALLDAEAAQPRVICCCCHCCSTRDIRALWLTFFMNTFFTIILPALRLFDVAQPSPLGRHSNHVCRLGNVCNQYFCGAPEGARCAAAYGSSSRLVCSICLRDVYS